MTKSILPINPTYQQACDLIDNAGDETWLPSIQYICQRHQIEAESITRIAVGGNVLFRINDDFIVKLVPPNWAYQGEAEVEASTIIGDKLSLKVPQVVASGSIDGWVFVVMTILPGISLADVWSDLDVINKHSIIAKVGKFIHEIHRLEVPTKSCLAPNWQDYYQQLVDDCLPRHTRKQLPEVLLKQIPEYFAKHGLDRFNVLCDLDEKAKDIFIHMDLHPWNLMVEEKEEGYELSGVLDFGDAIIGRSCLLELATPLLFMCQGDQALCRTLLSNYQLIEESDCQLLVSRLMAVSLLRPACDFNFVLQQVPETAPRKDWESIAKQLFPLCN